MSNTEAVAARFITVADQLADLKEEHDELRDELARLAPEIEGEFPFEAGKYTVIVTRPERWKWDQAQLKTIFAHSDTLPPWAKKTISIDKRAFQRLPSDQQGELHPALTRDLAAAKVKVVEEL